MSVKQNTNTNPDLFWMVYAEGEPAPVGRFPTEEAALSDARRVRDSIPGTTVFVLRAVRKVFTQALDLPIDLPTAPRSPDPLIRIRGVSA